MAWNWTSAVSSWQPLPWPDRLELSQCGWLPFLAGVASGLLWTLGQCGQGRVETTGTGKKNLGLALDWLHDAFRDAPVLGSLLNPAKTDAARIVQWEDLSAALDQALRQEQTDEQLEAAVVAQGLAKAAVLLAGKYHWVVTNVPYLARGKQIERLRDFASSIILPPSMTWPRSFSIVVSSYV